jgi:hypothetical protein
MVKKIRVLDEPITEELEDVDLKKVYELLKTTDWKLWEILQIMQRFEKKISILDDQSLDNEEKDEELTPKTRRVK